MKPKFTHRIRISVGKGADGKYKYESFTGHGDTPAKARKDAEFKAEEWKVLHKNEQRSGLTFAAAALAYVQAKEHVLSPSTIRGYEAVRKHHLKSLQDKNIMKITQYDIQCAINEEAAAHSPKTVRNISGFLSAVITMFRRDFKYYVTLPQLEEHDVKIPSEDTIAEILRGVKEKDPEMFKAIILAAFGSLRRSEICALTPDDIVDGKVKVSKALVPDKNQNYVLKATKTVKSKRTIKMPPFVIRYLMDNDGEHVVSLRPPMVTSRFATIAKRVNVPDFTFHGLRHYQASILHAMGVPDKYVQKRGGWSTDSTLKRVYQHTIDDVEESIDDEICKYFEEKFDFDYES